MASGNQYTEEFKIEAVKQVTERGRPLGEVADRLSISLWSLQRWKKHYATPPAERAEVADPSVEFARLNQGHHHREGPQLCPVRAQPGDRQPVRRGGRAAAHDGDGRAFAIVARGQGGGAPARRDGTGARHGKRVDVGGGAVSQLRRSRR